MADLQELNVGRVVGPKGTDGVGVGALVLTDGTGEPGTTDTYTLYRTDGSAAGTIKIHNGADGATLPPPSPEGAFLRVQAGAWAAVQVPDAEEASF